MDKEQQKYLRSRLDQAKSEHRSAQWDAKESEPANVKRARAVVTRFERINEVRKNKKRKALESAAEKVREAIVIGGDSKRALALLTDFEKRSFV